MPTVISFAWGAALSLAEEAAALELLLPEHPLSTVHSMAAAKAAAKMRFFICFSPSSSPPCPSGSGRRGNGAANAAGGRPLLTAKRGSDLLRLLRAVRSEKLSVPAAPFLRKKEPLVFLMIPTGPVRQYCTRILFQMQVFYSKRPPIPAVRRSALCKTQGGAAPKGCAALERT